MAKITKNEIQDTSRLARIELSDQELDSITKDIDNILNFVELINNANTSQVKPTSQVNGLSDVWREDEIVKSQVEASELLALAPYTQDGYIKVGKVL
ncbi:MAG: Asp-tRNA(Asn)/Glu-tRNA(Gln) amidotransferase subunit GatC [Patescibacteria group bacterium]|nr:Asp-tRNA(Asn)/Glu-tRNA(Gln) amidotransferase subunit GatC [Patescibacteria group bacterium]